MSEEVTIWYVDLAGNTYYYIMTELERRRQAKTVGSPDFDDDAFQSWCINALDSPDGLYPYNGGRISPKVLARVYYTTKEET